MQKQTVETCNNRSKGPCKSCPWIKTNQPGGDNIQGFSIEMMRDLSSTVPPRGSDQDGFFKVMACHHSKDSNMRACAGYIAVHGFQNINVRLMAARGKIDIKSVIKAAQKHSLYTSFYDMLDSFELAVKNKKL